MQRYITLKLYFHSAAQLPAEKAERVKKKLVKLWQLAGERKQSFLTQKRN